MNGKTLYTLDRLGTLSAGARIEHQTACCSIELQEHVANRFWSQVSRHGNNYFFNHNINLLKSKENMSVFMEMLLEEEEEQSFQINHPGFVLSLPVKLSMMQPGLDC